MAIIEKFIFWKKKYIAWYEKRFGCWHDWEYADPKGTLPIYRCRKCKRGQIRGPNF